MRRHAVAGLTPHPRYHTNFLGVLIDPKFFPDILNDRAGQVEGIPIPANWHADIAEWGGALRAVDLAQQGTFTAMELGCGWGCWLNMTGSAARRRGLKTQLIGVEADDGHLRFAQEAAATNGFGPEQLTLYRGVVAARPGVALFPLQDASVSWGLEPVFFATGAQRKKALATGGFAELPIISLAELTRDRERIDLLHVDIQGGEADLVEGSAGVLRQKVAYLLLGSHSRQIEGRLFSALIAAGWQLEIERPAILTLEGGEPRVSVDGVQGWRNPALLPQ